MPVKQANKNIIGGFKMSKKHFIQFNDIFIKYFNNYRSKKELELISKILSDFCFICYRFNNNFDYSTFYNRIHANLKPKQQTLLKRFKLNF